MKSKMLVRAAVVSFALAGIAGAQFVPQVIGLGGGCGDPKPLLNTTSPLLTEDLTVFVTGVTPGCPTTIFISPPTGPYEIAPGCTGWVDPATPMVFSGVADANGAFSVTFPTVSLVGFAPGTPCNLQAVCVAPPGTTGAVPFLGFDVFISDGVQIIMGDIPADPPSDVPPGACCTYSTGGYQGNGAPGQLFLNNYLASFPNGLIVGDYQPGNGSTSPNGKKFSSTLTGRTKIREYLKGGATPGIFNADTLDNSESTGAGNLGRQTVALTLSVTFSDLGVTPTTCTFGDLIYINPGDSLSGLSVRQILAAANLALSGGGFPAGYVAGTMNALVANLNLSYDNCVMSAWAGTRLFLANA
jgi:hypothetical protein